MTDEEKQTLIADALKTYEETGKTPSELSLIWYEQQAEIERLNKIIIDSYLNRGQSTDE